MIPDGLSEETVRTLIIPGDLIERFNVYYSKRKHSIREHLVRSKVLPEEEAQLLFNGIKRSHYYFALGKVAFEIHEDGGIQKLVDVIPTRAKKHHDAKPRENNKKACFPLDFEKIKFEDHALIRLNERYAFYVGVDLCKPEERARQLLAGATEEGAISKVGLVKRLIANKCEEVRYFRNNMWRFVIQEEEDGTYLVKTIEYAYLK